MGMQAETWHEKNHKREETVYSQEIGDGTLFLVFSSLLYLIDNGHLGVCEDNGQGHHNHAQIGEQCMASTENVTWQPEVKLE